MHRLQPILRAIGGHRATLLLLGLAAALVLGGLAGLLDIAAWIWLPGVALLINLAAALTVWPALAARPWLFAFHALIGALVLGAMADWLTALSGNVEMTEGAAFAPELAKVEAGPLHPMALDRVEFVQGGVEIRYAPGMKRRETRSTVLLPDGAGGWRPHAVGDERPLIAAGYRFYTTHNKGFAPVVSFTDTAGRRVGGTVHMPSYPLFSHRQANEWTPPGGPRVGLWLRLDAPLYDTAAPWRFARPQSPELVVVLDGRRHPLAMGESVAVPGGRIGFEGLRVWMGYTIVSNSLAPWLMALALAAGICLALHLWTTLAPAARTPAGRVSHG